VRPPPRSYPLVVAAPSGAGKTSLARALVERNANVVFSISATTRPPRPHEKDGRDYHFVDDAEFRRMAETGLLAEWAVVHGRSYGTPRQGVEDSLRAGHIVVLDIDVQGARQVREAFPDAVLVFILPPSGGELNRRLTGRGSEGDGERRRRLGNARAELTAVPAFDYIVVNEHFDQALEALETIVEAETMRIGRDGRLEPTLRRLDRELHQILGDH
jgi:guanylate kinase